MFPLLKKISCRAACLCLLLCAPALSAQAAPATPAVAVAQDQVKAEGLSLLQRGDYERAYKIFMRLLRDNPDDDDINLALGKVSFETGRYTQAIMAYERLSMRYPADARWRVALARVYVKLKEMPAARREMDTARRLDPSVTEASVEQALQRMAQADARWQVHGRVTAGVTYDSNVNMGPDSDMMDLGIWRDVRVRDVDAKDSWGTFVNGRLEAGWRTGDSSPWWIMGDTAFYKKLNLNQSLPSNQEFGWGRVGLGLRYVGADTLLDLRMKGDIADQNKEQRVNGWGPEATFVWAAHRRVQFITSAALDMRSYTQGDRQDGQYWWAGEYLRTFWGEAGHELTAGFRLMNGAADDAACSYHGWEASLNARVKLPWQLELTPFVALRKQYYDGAATVLEHDDRKDSLWRYGVGLVYSVNDNVQLEASWQHGSNDSESPLYAYEQDIFTTGVTWRF